MDIVSVLEKVFALKPGELIVVLSDLPADGDTPGWRWRRDLAGKWSKMLGRHYQVRHVTYKATYANNMDLPAECDAEGTERLLSEVLAGVSVVIALTEYSATAPLKGYAKKTGLRAASMPGFSEEMLPALMLDYDDVGKKVNAINAILEKSDSARIIFTAAGRDYPLTVDLRNRKPKKDDGKCTEPGTVINLPSGEAFIVPFEGKESLTAGFLPIEKDGRVTVYRVNKNNIVSALGMEDGLVLKSRADKAVGNIAELAFGVLGMYGIKGCGEVLLDEKLGMHIALGRSEHLGGETSPESFKNPKNVWHQDFVYTKDMQPSIVVKEAVLSPSRTKIIDKGEYVLF